MKKLLLILLWVALICLSLFLMLYGTAMIVLGPEEFWGKIAGLLIILIGLLKFIYSLFKIICIILKRKGIEIVKIYIFMFKKNVWKIVKTFIFISKKYRFVKIIPLLITIFIIINIIDYISRI